MLSEALEDQIFDPQTYEEEKEIPALSIVAIHTVPDPATACRKWQVWLLEI